MHKQNGTAAWITARDTPELGLYVSRVAREEDNGHLNKEMRRDQVDYRKDRAENKKQELAEKLERRKALSSKREAIEVHLEVKYWKDLLISRSATLVQVKAQLSWLRAPSRKLLVTVPPGLSNGKKDHILIGLITILEGLDATKINISEGEDSSVSEEEG
ncbi:hypothetical protein EWM64_g6016 [Hericium alpestre]|uniref:Uncharacterized protein n=1 Tax=Hericium alpestre TaxID=135208 RepID=A0A4Y9ZSX8_9AGAM|nr:hypothetical protein EWM64_g6016 [Hericium alpestre]